MIWGRRVKRNTREMKEKRKNFFFSRPKTRLSTPPPPPITSVVQATPRVKHCSGAPRVENIVIYRCEKILVMTFSDGLLTCVRPSIPTCKPLWKITHFHVAFLAENHKPNGSKLKITKSKRILNQYRKKTFTTCHIISPHGRIIALRGECRESREVAKK